MLCILDSGSRNFTKCGIRCIHRIQSAVEYNIIMWWYSVVFCCKAVLMNTFRIHAEYTYGIQDIQYTRNTWNTRHLNKWLISYSEWVVVFSMYSVYSRRLLNTHRIHLNTSGYS